jgi:predicted HTH domain antitoxin
LALSASGLTKDRIASESRKLLALKCFKDRVLSLGRAAELSGLSKWDFIEYLSDNDVPAVDYDEDELTRELETAEQLTQELKNVFNLLPVKVDQGSVISLLPVFKEPIIMLSPLFLDLFGSNIITVK